MMDIVQARIAQSDLTREQQDIIRSISDTLKKKSLAIGKTEQYR